MNSDFVIQRMVDPKCIPEEGNGENSGREGAHLLLLMGDSGSAASPRNHGRHVVGLEGYMGTGTWGRLGSLVRAVALDAACRQNAAWTV